MTIPGDVTQSDLWGDDHPPQGLDLSERVEWVMDRYPATRGNDVLLDFRCWQHFDGLAVALGPGAMSKAIVWASRDRITTAETYRRRRQEIQHLRSADGAYLPSDDVVAERRRKDGAGPPGKR